MPSKRCVLCDGPHFAGECTTYFTLEDREHAVQMLKLCVQCLQPAVTDHVHIRGACKHCGEAHYSALCPLEPWRRGKTCAFCLEYHHSDACKKYPRLKDRLRAVEALKICRRCLSRSHKEDGCTSIHRCVRCDERHHHALCWKTNKRRRHRIRSVSPLLGGLWSVSPELSRQETYDNAVNVVSDDADEIKIIKVVQGTKPMPPLNEPSKGTSKQSSSQTEHQKQHDKVKIEADEGRRELRLTKEANHRAEEERESARKEREAAQDECKALDNESHDLEHENRNSEAIRQVIAAAVKASTEFVTNREEERRRTIEQERDDAAKKLLEAEKRIEALKNAASDAVRLTVEFQAWRIRAVIKAKKNGTSQKQSNNDREDGAAFPETVATAVQKVAKIEAEEASTDNARKRPSASSAPVGKRRRIDSVKPTAEELSQKLDAVLAGYSESVSEKYKLFFVENLRGSVTIEELVQFVRVRCPSDVDLADNVLESFTTSP